MTDLAKKGDSLTFSDWFPKEMEEQQVAEKPVTAAETLPETPTIKPQEELRRFGEILIVIKINSDLDLDEMA